MAHTAQPTDEKFKRLAELAQAHPEHRHAFDCLLPHFAKNVRAMDAIQAAISQPKSLDGLHWAFAICQLAHEDWVERIRERGYLLLLGAVQ